MNKVLVTIFMARAGSKLLLDLINEHPDVMDHGEVFHDRERAFRGPEDIFRKMSSLLLCEQRVCGFQFRFERHFREFPEIVEFIEANAKDVSVVFLQRNNKLKGAISQQNAERLKRETGRAHRFKGGGELSPLRVEVERAVREALERERLDEKYRQWIRSRFANVQLSYEELVKDPLRATNNVFDLLGLSRFKRRHRFQSDLVKATSDNLKDAVSNYDELEARIRQVGRMEWLIAEEGTAAAPAGSATAAGRLVVTKTKTILDHQAELRPLGVTVGLTAERFPVRTRTSFLEHVVGDRAEGGGRIIAADGRDILESKDGGRTWISVPGRREYQRCFTLRTGAHLLQGEDGTIDRYGGNWEFLNSVETGRFPWHGSWSIDENTLSGVVIWGEYPYAADEVRVWRSVDGGDNWEPVLTERGDAGNPKGGRVRHFHVCQHCTTYRNRWYVASGDTEKQSRFWVSDDDGKSWDEVAMREVQGLPPGFPEPLRQRLFRFTSVIQCEDRLIFPTDDTFGGLGSLVVAMDKRDLGRLTVFAGKCGRNESRNFIKVADNRGLVFSESKLDRTGVDVSLVDFEGERVFSVALLKNKRQVKANFMNSRSSRAAEEGAFYSFYDNSVLSPGARILAWRFRENEGKTGGRGLLARLRGSV